MADILQIIKYEGDNFTFIWKHPIEDFVLGSQLIVHESQEAVFFMDGQALDSFPAGRYTLTTENLPLIGKFFNFATGGKTPFHCEIYFVNKTEQMAIKWGTDSKVEYIDPTYNFPISIGASGEMSLRLEDPRKLLLKVVGTENSITQQMLVQKFRGFLLTHCKTYLANLIREKNIHIFAIDEHLSEISKNLQEKLSVDFLDYGVALERFFVTTIVKPEEDKAYQKFKELHFRKYADVTEAEIRQKVGLIDQTTQTKRMVIEAEGLAQKRSLEGYTYQEERGYDVAEKVASNEAVGEMSNLGIGLGLVTGVGGTIGQAVGGVMQETMGKALGNQGQLLQPDKFMICPNCKNSIPANSNFCSECGIKILENSEELITCPSCGAKTPKGKFCKECGKAFPSICPNCNKEITPSSKFCPECGHKL